MKPIWTSDRLIAALGGTDSGAIPDISGVSIDTRTLQPGDLFVALTGDSRDGHAFVRAAFEKGAAAALINVAHHAELQTTGPVIAVEDTLDSLRHLGVAARERSSARICAVTGSVGKTGTKDALRTVLELQGEAHASVGRSPPDFLIDETPLDGLRKGLWLLLITAASLVLLAQLAYVYRNELVTRVPSLLPLARAACEPLKCAVSFVRHLERITLEATSLEQAPGGQEEGQQSTLALKFSMRNRYDKIQPWPHLSLELRDASGTPVIRKVVPPEQYLPQHLVGRPFAANQEIHIHLPVTVSGLQISGFQLYSFFP